MIGSYFLNAKSIVNSTFGEVQLGGNNACSNPRDFGYPNMKKVPFRVPWKNPLVANSPPQIMDFAIVSNLSRIITIRISWIWWKRETSMLGQTLVLTIKESDVTVKIGLIIGYPVVLPLAITPSFLWTIMKIMYLAESILVRMKIYILVSYRHFVTKIFCFTFHLYSIS